ncbi:Protein YIPF1 [Taenia crassiceps]|uniref:Protein YIPF n=1 Tax=Taenia crassiceps TaxID=6207 RepID=A0ABR4QAC3_9CEST
MKSCKIWNNYASSNVIHQITGKTRAILKVTAGESVSGIEEYLVKQRTTVFVCPIDLVCQLVVTFQSLWSLSSRSLFSLIIVGIPLRSYFDVDTYQVVRRVLSGLIPFSKRFSLSASLRPAPDFYGPFWIIVTLIFSIAFSGSIYESIVWKNASSLSTFNFGRVTISAAILFVYWCLIPIILTSLAWLKRRNVSSEAQGIDRGSEFTFGSLFSNLLAIYGYSMVSYIPVAMLLCVPVSLIQWILIGTASLVSLCVLASATWVIFKQKTKQLAIGLLVLIVIAHIAMTASLFAVFFHQPPLEPQPKPAPAVQPADTGALDRPTLQESVGGGGADIRKDAPPKEAPIKPPENNPGNKAGKNKPNAG